MVITDVPHVYPLADWRIDGWCGMEDVGGVQVSECRVINELVSRMKSAGNFDPPKWPRALLYTPAWMTVAGNVTIMPAPGCQVQWTMVPGVQGGMLAPPCMDHWMCSWPGRWYRRGKAGCLPLPAWTIG